MEGRSKWRHSGGETRGSGVNMLSQCNEELLLGPERSLRGQI